MMWWQYLLIGIGAFTTLYVLYFLVVLAVTFFIGKKVFKNFRDW